MGTVTWAWGALGREAATSQEPSQPVALTLAGGPHVARQIERQAAEVAQPEVLRLAALGARALLLLCPQAPLVDVGRRVRVAGASLAPTHCICEGEGGRWAQSQHLPPMLQGSPLLSGSRAVA